MERNKTDLGDMVYDHILRMIFTEQIKSGEKISEQKIISALGVSRTPFREAVKRLSGDGIVKLYPNRYAEVIRFDEQFIQDLGIMRLTLDSLSVQLAIYHGSNHDFSNLRALSLKCAEADLQRDLYNRIKYDCDFHMALVTISENQLLIDMQRSLFLKTQLLQTIRLSDESNCICDIHKHEEILDALYARNADVALKAVQSHLLSFYNLEHLDIRFPSIHIKP